MDGQPVCPVHGYGNNVYCDTYHCFWYDMGYWRLSRLSFIIRATVSVCSVIIGLSLAGLAGTALHTGPQLGVTGLGALFVGSGIASALPLIDRVVLPVGLLGAGCVAFFLLIGEGWYLPALGTLLATGAGPFPWTLLRLLPSPPADDVDQLLEDIDGYSAFIERVERKPVEFP